MIIRSVESENKYCWSRSNSLSALKSKDLHPTVTITCSSKVTSYQSFKSCKEMSHQLHPHIKSFIVCFCLLLENYIYFYSSCLYEAVGQKYCK